jgi:type III pantothenate kinase
MAFRSHEAVLQRRGLGLFFLSGNAAATFPPMLLLFDIGNTHTHVALSQDEKFLRPRNFRTEDWASGKMPREILRHIGRATINAAGLCSVVPPATSSALAFIERTWGVTPFQLNSATVRGIGIDYPKATTIGPDRLANAVAARKQFGAPVVVVDFGTAVTFDVVNRSGDYVGGIIAPGLEVMTTYLHDKTALLPRIKIRDVSAIVGKSTEQAMLIGAVHGYRGLIRELVQRLKAELKCRRLPVVATGGYAELLAKGLPEIAKVDPLLTLKGLHLACELARSPK